MRKISFNICSNEGVKTLVFGYALDNPFGLSLGIDKEGNNIDSSKRWCVTELVSGFILATGDWGGTRQQARDRAFARVQQYGVAEVKRRVDNAIKDIADKVL